MAIWRTRPRAQQPKTPIPPLAPPLQIGDGLRISYRFDENTATTRNDSVGDNHLADIGAGVVKVTPGLVGVAAASFNETAYLSTGHAPSNTFLASLHIGVWLKLDAGSSGGFPGIVGKWGAGDLRSFALLWNASLNRIGFSASADGTNATAVSVFADIFGNVPTGTKLLLEAFVNHITGKIGVAVNRGTFNEANFIGPLFNTTADFEVGRLGTSTNVIFGILDGLTLWDRQLTEANRTTYWNNGNGIEVVSPVARAGLDQRRKVNEYFCLDGSQSVGDGLTYLWSQISGTPVMLADSDSPTPHGTAPATPGTLVFQLDVEELDEDTDSDQVSIDIVAEDSNEWLSYTPEEANIDPNIFYSNFDSMPEPSIVLRHGRIIGAKGDITLVGPTWSASKALSALVAGSLLHSEDIDYDDLIPDSDVPTGPEATLHQFLAMMSDYGLDPHSPGAHFAYNNAAVHLYISYLKSVFYSSLTNVEMYESAYLTALDLEDTPAFSGFYSGWDGGLELSTRDICRVALCLLNGGVHNGVRIFAESFMAALWTSQIPDSATPHDDLDDEFFNQNNHIDTDVMQRGWGLGIWYLGPHTGDPVTYPVEMLAMLGKFGTAVYISREKDMVAACVNVGGATEDGPETKISAIQFGAIVDASSEASLIHPIPGQLLVGD